MDQFLENGPVIPESSVTRTDGRTDDGRTSNLEPTCTIAPPSIFARSAKFFGGILSVLLPPKGAIVQVGSKFDVRPSSVRVTLSHEITQNEPKRKHIHAELN